MSEQSLPGLLPTVLDSKALNTQLAYSQDLARFMQFRKAASPAAAVEDLLSRPVGEANQIALAYRNWMHSEKKLAPASVNRSLAALRSVVRHAQAFGRVSWSLAVRGLPIERRSRDTRGPGREAVTRMMAIARAAGGAKGARDVCILMLLYALGLRRGEVASLRVCDVDLDGMRLAVSGKGRYARQWMLVPPDVESALGAWLAVYESVAKAPAASGEIDTRSLMVSLRHGRVGDPLRGDGIYWVVRSIGDAAAARATPHGLRHTGATELIRRGRSLDEVVRWTRHRNLATLQCYIDAEEGAELDLADQLAIGLGA